MRQTAGGIGSKFTKFANVSHWDSQSCMPPPTHRWALHALCEVVFLIIFQLIIMYPDSHQFQRPLCAAFELFVLGNLLDVMHFVSLKYGSLGMLQRYAQGEAAVMIVIATVISYPAHVRCAQGGAAVF